ncbi:MAG: bifunctional diaminohydroxyphosphoribosylaminopyrimidine deaminase/5-amino-6-(5-phosphoribosylamino)uracil reductase RibD [Desulfovibrionaceae bacterium]|nr:bifunctional diaminohydroxyphosphoribosylaminopyrimidine deaminase/5-amino-6-(5-phosphoribosylamino)uracil reductase RibD [Desulfovibrionaceae bacterium]
MDNFVIFMQEALKVAKKANLQTYPNPSVGAVLVYDQKIVAEGYHHKAGEPHAEIECLKQAYALGIDPAQSTLVVTLEPCNHYGKTPPCTEAILKAGIKTLVFGCYDPHAKASGGAAYLKTKGLKVIGPVLEEACQAQIRDFYLWQTEKRPYVFLKMAATLDGRIATRSNDSKWISSESSRQEVQKLRAKIALAYGGILIGGNTFRLDDPRLTVRLASFNGPQAKALILTSSLPDPENKAKSFYLINHRPKETIFFTTKKELASPKAARLKALGLQIFAPKDDHKGEDLLEWLKISYQDLNCPYLMCEGGGKLALSLLRQGLVDEFQLYLSPLIIADQKAIPLFQGLNPERLSEALRLKIFEVEKIGEDLRVILRP